MKSNIFEVTGESVLMLYGSHLTGAPTSTLLVLSVTPLGDAALEALEKSAASLEFGAAPLARVVVETDEGKLGAEDVRTIVEGLDPVALVACDAFAAETLSAAMDARCYHGEQGRTRLHALTFGRGDALAAVAMALLVTCVVVINLQLV